MTDVAAEGERETLGPVGAALDAALRVAGCWHLAGMDYQTALALAAEDLDLDAARAAEDRTTITGAT